MKRACRSCRVQSLLILCSSAVYYFLYFGNARTYVGLLCDFVLPGGPVNRCQVKSLNYLRLNPNLIEQILASFHVKSCRFIRYTPLFMPMPKAITAAFQRQTILKEIIKSVAMQSQARGYEVILICICMNDLHKWILSEY